LIILVDNAVKFSSDGDVVTIHVQRLPLDPRFLLVDVSDTGCGLSPEMTERIFERLYQVSEPTQDGRKGLGLGLYICKELVTRLGGQIWVKHQAEKGCTFSFTLPVYSPNDPTAPLLEDDTRPAESVALGTVDSTHL
jgi:signal transduction histidine kinase